MLNTQETIIYTADVDGEKTFSFQNTTIKRITITIQSIEYGIEPGVIFPTALFLSAGDSVIAFADSAGIIHKVFDGLNDITPVQVLVPAINSDSLILRGQNLILMLSYLVRSVTASNYNNFITTFRNQMTDYERGVNTLQTAIDASSAVYLTVEIKTQLKNNLN